MFSFGMKGSSSGGVKGRCRLRFGVGDSVGKLEDEGNGKLRWAWL